MDRFINITDGMCINIDHITAVEQNLNSLFVHIRGERYEVNASYAAELLKAMALTSRKEREEE